MPAARTAGKEKPTRVAALCGRLEVTKEVYMKVRPIRIEGDLAYVPLTKGYEAVIDAADVCLVENFNWYADTSHGHTVYARRNVNNGKPCSIKMHRVITGCEEGLLVDHKDCNGLNNRR